MLAKKDIFSIILITSLSLFLGLDGGFPIGHPDSEYLSSRDHKTNFLHYLYKPFIELDFQLHKNQIEEYAKAYDDKFTDDELREEFKVAKQKSALALYLVNGFFNLLGIIFTYLLAISLSRNRSIAIMASLILATCFFWVSHSHYPTVDLPVAAFSITSFYFLRKSKLFLASILLGFAVAAKTSALCLLIPAIIYIFNSPKKYSKFLSLITIAFLSFIPFILAKFNTFINAVKTESQILYSSGQIGDENILGHTFLYHLETSFHNKYGLLVALFALIGIFHFYRENKKIDRVAFFAFILGLYCSVSSSKIEAPRYIMPIIPFISILSSYGIDYLSQIFNKHIQINKVFLSAILLALSIFPNLNLAIKHNQLMKKADLHFQLLYGISRRSDLSEKFNHIYNDPIKHLLPGGLFNKASANPAQENHFSCDSTQKVNFKWKYFRDDTNVVILTSYKHDRYIFDWRMKCDKFRKAFGNFQSLDMILINPFFVEKKIVPYSPLSKHSPNPPDIFLRNRNGPYVEIFTAKPEITKIITDRCDAMKINYKLLKANKSYFLNKIQGYNPKLI